MKKMRARTSCRCQAKNGLNNHCFTFKIKKLTPFFRSNVPASVVAGGKSSPEFVRDQTRPNRPNVYESQNLKAPVLVDLQGLREWLDSASDDVLSDLFRQRGLLCDDGPLFGRVSESRMEMPHTYAP